MSSTRESIEKLLISSQCNPLAANVCKAFLAENARHYPDRDSLVSFTDFVNYLRKNNLGLSGIQIKAIRFQSLMISYPSFSFFLLGKSDIEPTSEFKPTEEKYEVKHSLPKIPHRLIGQRLFPYLDDKMKAALQGTCRLFSTIPDNRWKNKLIDYGCDSKVLSSLENVKKVNFEKLFYTVRKLHITSMPRSYELWELQCLCGEVEQVKNAIKSGTTWDRRNLDGNTALELVVLAGNDECLFDVSEDKLEQQELDDVSYFARLAGSKRIHNIYLGQNSKTTLNPIQERRRRLEHDQICLLSGNLVFIESNTHFVRERLVSQDRDNDVSSTLLHIAAESDSIEVFKWIYGHSMLNHIDPCAKDDEENTVFDHAICRGALRVAKFIYAHRTDLFSNYHLDLPTIEQGCHYLHSAAKSGSVETMKFVQGIIKNECQALAVKSGLIFSAVKSGVVGMFDYVLSFPGVKIDDKNEKGKCLLTVAAKSFCFNLIPHLISKGLSIKVTPEKIDELFPMFKFRLHDERHLIPATNKILELLEASCDEVKEPAAKRQRIS